MKSRSRETWVGIAVATAILIAVVIVVGNRQLSRNGLLEFAMLLLVLLGLAAVRLVSTGARLSARDEAQLALGEREAFTRAILDSIAVEVAVLDRHGVIVAVNAQWRRFAALNAVEPGRPVAKTEVGTDYLAASGQHNAAGSEGARAVAGIRDVLAGRLASFTLDYGCHSAQQERWFRMNVTPLGSAEAGVVVTHEDITEVRRADAALRASEQLLEQTGRIGGIGGWKLDLATRAIEWTAQTSLIHDLEPRKIPTIEEALAFYPPGSRATVEHALAHSLETGAGYDLELPLVTAAGRAIWVRAVCEVESHDGRPMRLRGTFQDITARRAMETELRRNNELLTTVLASLPCGICVFDADARLVAWNETHLRLLDLPAELFDPRPPSLEDVARYLATHGEYGPCDVEDKVREVVHDVMTGPAHRFERTRPDGSTLEIRGARMPGGGIVSTFTDISARRNAEALAQRSTRLLSNAIETIDEAFVLFGPDRRLTYCNDKYRALFGSLSHFVVAGASFEDLAMISDSSGLFIPAQDGADPDDGADNGVRLRRLVDGRILRSMQRAMPDGHTVGMLVDVTQHLMATETAEQALLAKSQFLANISHEIRTPMNAVLGLLTLLHRTELGARQRDYVARTEGAAHALLGVLNAVLDFSKIESGEMRLDVHPFAMESLLRELSLLVSANVGRKALDLRFDIDPALPPVLSGDALRLQQVLVNLLGNAIKFTDAGTVQLTMRVVERSGAAVKLAIHVTDTGIGIAPENQERIFSGFTQAEASTTRRFGGTGLGLTICQHLVDLMGGRLAVESAIGAGSSFSFAIELQTAAPTPPGHPSAPARATPLRALTIADDVLAGELSARMGRSLGWDVEPIVDGHDAADLRQAALSARACDVAFVDCPVTGAIGRELREHAGARVLLGRLPLVLMGSLEERERLWARDPGGAKPREVFLIKPVTASMLDDAARSLLDPATAGAGALDDLRRLSGMCLLVVEDNPTNQLVARELLEAEGADVRVAADGQQAIDVLSRGGPGFDAVLMDLQMPVMDGFTAARRIRGELALHALPIIAMTANASHADRAESLAAGMNEHIGKPFDLNALVVLLRQLTGRSPEASALAAPPAPIPAEVSGIAEAAGVDLAGALARLNGNTRLYADLLSAFLAELASTEAELHRLAQAGRWQELSGVLHATRGLAGTLGVTRTAVEAARAEAAAVEATDPSTCRDAVTRVCDSLGDAKGGLSRLRAHFDSAVRTTAPSVAPAELGDVVSELSRILRLLRGSDMQTLEAVATLHDRVGDAMGTELGLLVESVNLLKFERAAELCDGLIARLTQR